MAKKHDQYPSLEATMRKKKNEEGALGNEEGSEMHVVVRILGVCALERLTEVVSSLKRGDCKALCED